MSRDHVHAINTPTPSNNPSKSSNAKPETITVKIYETYRLLKNLCLNTMLSREQIRRIILRLTVGQVFLTLAMVSQEIKIKSHLISSSAHNIFSEGNFSDISVS